MSTIPKLANIIFILGFQKCGSGTLHGVLTRSPGVQSPGIKETNYFSLSDDKIESNRSAYFNVLSGNKILDKHFVPELKYIDSSIMYIHSTKALKNILEHTENPRFLAILRDPIERAYSAYLHTRKRSVNSDTRDFKHLLSEVCVCKSPEELMYLEKELVDRGIRNGHIDTAFVKNFYTGWLNEHDVPENGHDWPFFYFSNGLYSYHLRKAEDILGKEIYTINLNDLRSNNSLAIQRMFNYLQLNYDENCNPSSTTHLNKTRYPRNEFARSLLKFYKSTIAGSPADRFVKTISNRVSPLFFKNVIDFEFQHDHVKSLKKIYSSEYKKYF